MGMPSVATRILVLATAAQFLDYLLHTAVNPIVPTLIYELNHQNWTKGSPMNPVAVSNIGLIWGLIYAVKSLVQVSL